MNRSHHLATVLFIAGVAVSAQARTFDLARNDGLFGVKDDSGVVVIEPTWKILTLQRVGLFPVVLFKNRDALIVDVKDGALLQTAIKLGRTVAESPPSFPIPFCGPQGCGLLNDAGDNMAGGGFYDEIVAGGVLDNGLYHVRRGALWGLIDHLGHVLAAPTWTSVSRTQGWPKVAVLDGKTWLVSAKGKPLNKEPVDEVINANGEAFVVRKGQHQGALSPVTGAMVVAASWDSVVVVNAHRFVVVNAGKHGLVDDKGGVLVAADNDDLQGPFAGRYRARRGNRYRWLKVDAPKSAAAGGNTVSHGDDEPIDEAFLPRAKDGVLSLVVDAQEPSHLYAEGRGALTLALINRTAQRATPLAEDGALAFDVETQGKDGSWTAHPELRRDITCGNSRGIAVVEPGQQRLAAFVRPKDLKGPLRFVIVVDGEKVTSAPMPR